MAGIGHKVVISLITLYFLVHLTNQFRFPNVNVDKNGNLRRQYAVGSRNSCTPLRNCDAYIWVLDNTRNLREINSMEFFNVLKGKRCDVEDARSKKPLTMNTLVACPREVDVQLPDYENDDDNDYNNVEEYEYPLDEESDSDSIDVRDGWGIFRMSGSSATCSGSIDISHGSRKDPIKTIQILRFSSKWKQIANMRKLRNRLVLRIKSEGNCCWRTYQYRHFRGRSEDIDSGYDILPRFYPKSIKQIECGDK